MKLAVVLLVSLFLPLQTFYYMNCCCGDLCTHKNACTGCEGDQSKPCEMHPGHQPGGDCCPDQDHSAGTSKHEHEKACSHLSPSSEVTVQAADPAPPIPTDFVLLALPTILEPEPTRARGLLLEQFARTRSDVPRYLLLSVLLI